MEHGTASMYNHMRCRCLPCKEASRKYRSSYKSPHHGLSGYVTGCRCGICKEAKSLYQKVYRRAHPLLDSSPWVEIGFSKKETLAIIRGEG